MPTYTSDHKTPAGPPCPRCGEPTIKFVKIADYDDIGCTSVECRVVWRRTGVDELMGNERWLEVKTLPRECWSKPSKIMAAITHAALDR